MAAEAAEQTEKPAVQSYYNGDLTIELNTSDLNKSSVTPSKEEIYKLGFSLNDLYKLSLLFYKKDADTLLIPYADKVQLVALWKQVTCGKFDESKSPDIGYFDVIGNDRKKAWEGLGDLSVDDAKKSFISILESKTANFTPFIEMKKREIEVEIEKKRLEREERAKKEEEIRRRNEEEERIRREEAERIKQTLQAEKLAIEEKKKKEEEEALEKNQLLESSPKFLSSKIVGNSTGKSMAQASLWTRPKLQEFITHVKRDANSVLVIGRGETVTIRVPTHENGSCLFWEFATEFYDIGFGVYFEWTSGDNSTAEETLKKHLVVHENENNDEVILKASTDEVLPVLRRNSHEEVIVGSHLYPGQGIYLLKFDNSYSLLRSKSLYYRVYYTK
ncbi:Golgi resident protein GCP60 isoform X2 [Hydra vulgaris]|uniref:Golgi resident protein GCP60 isoform X2 n=1 Tax=Hydra vulgaris TaxID=6087 RepID=A0ABM4CIH3_HYDVU